MQERGCCREKYPMTICLQKFCRNYGRYLKRRARSFSRNSIAGYHSMTGTIVHQRPEQEDTGPASGYTILKRIQQRKEDKKEWTNDNFIKDLKCIVNIAFAGRIRLMRRNRLCRWRHWW